jgi:predicted RNase H-like HicB family nuclease
MLTNYIHAALRQAKYEIIEGGQYYGEIPGFDGVWASTSTLEACREELRETLEDWLVLGLRMGHSLPVVDGINLIPAEAA